MIRLLASLLLLHTSLQAQTWRQYSVGNGIKPDITIDSKGHPHIGFMSEDVRGFVAHADLTRLDSIVIDTIDRSYFYGPVAMAINGSDQIAVAVHDHTSEDEKICENTSMGQWNCVNIEDFGHDGWDNDLVYDSDNNLYTSSVDPSTGIESANRKGGIWGKSNLPSIRLDYSHGTGIALGVNNQQFIVYYDPIDIALMLARSNGETWRIDQVAQETGRYPHIGIDKKGQVHLVFTTRLSISSYIIRYAMLQGDNWVHSTIDTLSNVNGGARRIVTIDFDSDDNPTVAYADTKVVMYAYREGDSWAREVAIDYRTTTNSLGASVAHKMSTNAVHIATYTRNQEVLYLTKSLSTVPQENFEIKGRILNAKNQPVAGVSIRNLNAGQYALSAQDGTFTMTGISEIAQLSFSKEDEAGRGVTASDIILISNHILGSKPFEDAIQIQAADVNNNNVVSSSDLVLIKNVLLGITTTWPSGKTWIFDKEGMVISKNMSQDPISVLAWKYGDVNNSTSPNE